MYFWRIGFFIIISDSSLSLITFLVLTYALSESRIVIPAFFSLVLEWYIFLHPCTFNWFVSLYLKLVSCKQHMVRSWFFFYIFTLSQICVCRPFTFKEMVDIWGYYLSYFLLFSIYCICSCSSPFSTFTNFNGTFNIILFSLFS